MPKFNDVDTICIVYPIGTGGNHLRNMISMCSGTSIDLSCDYANMVSAYETYYNQLGHIHELTSWRFTAHFGGSLISDYTNDANLANFINELKINCLYGHEAQYQILYDQDILQKILSSRNVVWIVVSWPNYDSIAYKRLVALEATNQANTGCYTLPFYPGKYFTLEVNEANGVIFDPDLFFTETGSEYVRNFLLENFDLELPKDADKIHKIWFDGVITAIDKYSL